MTSVSFKEHQLTTSLDEGNVTYLKRETPKGFKGIKWVLDAEDVYVTLWGFQELLDPSLTSKAQRSRQGPRGEAGNSDFSGLIRVAGGTSLGAALLGSVSEEP